MKLNKVLVDATSVTEQPKIYVLIGETAKITAYMADKTFPETIVSICNEFNCSSCEIKGSPTYVKGLIKKAKAEEIKTYSENKINFYRG